MNNSFIGSLVYLTVGYLVAAMLSSHVYMDLSLTEWTNVWTYAWIILWPMFSMVMIFGWAIAIIAIIVGSIFCFFLFMGGLSWLAERKG